MVPGHEIVGTVAAVGPEVRHLEIGARVGVGWQRGACLACDSCIAGDENLCAHNVATCVGNHGGFADRVRLDGRFAFPIPEALASENAAPLLCGGATVYSPLRRWVKPAMRVGVVGIGGLGHLGLQFAARHGLRGDGHLVDPRQGGGGPRLRRPPLPRDARAEGAPLGGLEPGLHPLHGLRDPGLGRAPGRPAAERGALPGRRHERAPVGPGVHPPGRARRPSPAPRSAAGPRSGRCWRSRPGTGSRRRRSHGPSPKRTPRSATSARAAPGTGSSSLVDARPARSARSRVSLAHWPGGRTRDRLRGSQGDHDHGGEPDSRRDLEAGLPRRRHRHRCRRRREGRSLAHVSRD